MDSYPLIISTPIKIHLRGTKRFHENLADPHQSWILQSNGGFRPCLGLKSESSFYPEEFFIHPIFREGTCSRSDPGSFIKSPRLTNLSWDWVDYCYQPFDDIEVNCLHWIPDPRAACGSFRIENRSNRDRKITLELLSQIPGNPSPINLVGVNSRGRQLLTGNWGDQSAAFLLTGGNDLKEIYVGFSCEIFLEPNLSQELRWILVSASKPALVNKYLQEVLSLDWTGEIAQRKIQIQNQVSIQTQKLEQDLILAKSQQQARQIFRSLVARSTDGGNPLKPLISPLQAWLLYQSLYPLTTDEMIGLLKLAFPKSGPASLEMEQSEELPGRLPISAELLWETYLAGFPLEVWVEYLPEVERRIRDFFHSNRDRDGDGIPEFPQLSPLLSLRKIPDLVHQSSQPGFQADLEHPVVSGLLLNEIHKYTALLQVKDPQANPDGIGGFSTHKVLEEFIRESWMPAEGRFRCRDYLSHDWIQEEYQTESLREGWNNIQQQLPQPCRLLLIAEKERDRGSSTEGMIILHGLDWMGRYRVEEISFSPYQRNSHFLGATSCRYSHLDYCRIEGLGSQVTIKLKGNLNAQGEISTFLPLWVPDLPEHIVNMIIKKNLGNPQKYWTDLGLKTFPGAGAGAVQLPWNILLAQGLLRHGKSQLVVKLINGWMKAGSINTQTSGETFPIWESDTGLGWGKDYWIEELIPIKLILNVAGIEIRADETLILKDQSAFPDQIQIKYRGTMIKREENRVNIQHPAEKPYELHITGRKIIQLTGPSSANSST
jgi:hypothetical protein